jgi:hypothetical protein
MAGNALFLSGVYLPNIFVNIAKNQGKHQGAGSALTHMLNPVDQSFINRAQRPTQNVDGGKCIIPVGRVFT